MAFVRTIGGAERHFELLSEEDLESIMGTMPFQSGEIINIRALDQWAKNPSGSKHYIYFSARKADPAVKLHEVAKWSSIMARASLAAEILAQSLYSGEETPPPKAPGEASPPTGK